MNDFTSFPIHQKSFFDFIDLGAVTDGSKFVGLKSGVGLFNATALRTYINAQIPPQFVVNVKTYGAVGDNSSNDTIPIQDAIDFAGSAGGGIVAVPAGTYLITAALRMSANVTLLGADGSVIKQGNSANLSTLIDFNTNAATSATLDGITLDGNRANNVNSGLTYMVVSSEDNTTVTNCLIQNAPGLGVLLLGGNYHRVTNNDFNSVFSVGVFVLGPAAASSSFATVEGNKFFNVGSGAVYVKWADYVNVTNNTVTGTKVNAIVSTSGTTVSWVSGTNFATLLAGMIIRIMGVEYLITQVNSPTTLTLVSSAGTQTSVGCVAGNGDQINVDTSSSVVVANNIILFGMSAGIMVHTFAGGASAAGTVVANNIIQSCGNMGIGLEVGSTLIDSTVISGNFIAACGSGFSANVANTNDGIYIEGSVNMGHVSLIGNVARDFGAGLQEYGCWVHPDAVSFITDSGNSFQGTVAESSGLGWISYTPTVTSSGGTLTLAAATGLYRRNGKVVNVAINVSVTTVGTGSGALRVTLPVTASAQAFVLSGRLRNNGHMLQAYNDGTAYVSVVDYANTFPGADGNTMFVSGSYEAA